MVPHEEKFWFFSSCEKRGRSIKNFSPPSPPPLLRQKSPKFNELVAMWTADFTLIGSILNSRSWHLWCAPMCSTCLVQSFSVKELEKQDMLKVNTLFELWKLIELSFNSTWVLVGSWLFCLQNPPCLVSLWYMRGGSMEVWTKNILYWFMRAKLILACTSWHAPQP